MQSLAGLRIATAVLGLTLSVSAQTAITWSVKDLAGPTDVSTKGKLCLAVNLGPEVCEKVVNGVHFQADRSHWTAKIRQRGGTVVRGIMYFPDITSGGYTLKVPYNRTAPNIGPRDTKNADYDFILKDGRHTPGGVITTTCEISGLTPGSTYEIQVFSGNKGRPTRVAEWDNGIGGRLGKGGILLKPQGALFGQFATGTFKATASGKQTFANYQHPADPNATPPLPQTFNACSAIQIRELTPKALAPRATYYGEGTPGTNTQPNLGGTKCSPAIAFTGHPKIGTKHSLTAENSVGSATNAMLVVGLAPVNVPFIGGTLLVRPDLTLAVPMPAPASPYVHAHELQIPITVPATPVPVYVQVLQRDTGAPFGVSFTPAMKLEIGL